MNEYLAATSWQSTPLVFLKMSRSMRALANSLRNREFSASSSAAERAPGVDRCGSLGGCHPVRQRSLRDCQAERGCLLRPPLLGYQFDCFSPKLWRLTLLLFHVSFLSVIYQMGVTIVTRLPHPMAITFFSIKRMLLPSSKSATEYLLERLLVSRGVSYSPVLSSAPASENSAAAGLPPPPFPLAVSFTPRVLIGMSAGLVLTSNTAPAASTSTLPCGAVLA